MIKAAITAIGGYLPDYVLTNQELEKMVDTSDEWIRERTGILERRILKGNRGTSDMAVEAVKQLLEKRGIGANEIEMLICCTVTPDHTFPATANIITHKLGNNRAWGFDLEAACSGFLYGLTVGAKMIESGFHKKVVVVGSDKMSSIIDYTDRNTCIIFGDGCGAVLLEPSEEGVGVMDSILYADGSGMQYLHMKAGGSVKQPSVETVQNREHYVYQEGKAVFKFAVYGMAEVAYEMMQRHNLKPEDIAYLVPHQANKRIIDACAQRMNLPEEKVMVNIQRYGNTTAGTIPLCLLDWEKNLKKGDNLILAAFGGGFTWGSVFVKWAYNSN